MKLTSESFSDQRAIPPEFAFGVPHETDHVALGANRNPHLQWHDLPAGTRSLVLICHDPDAPTKGDDVNKEGRTVPASLPRQDFFHWVLIDLPPQPDHILAGEFSEGVSVKGKPGPDSHRNARHGLNDYTGWFSGHESMEGQYHGYDGPCPPWNDEIPHRYLFTVYALDIDRLSLPHPFTGPQVRAAIAGHVLGQASLTGWYSLNPSVKSR